MTTYKEKPSWDDAPEWATHILTTGPEWSSEPEIEGGYEFARLEDSKYKDVNYQFGMGVRGWIVEEERPKTDKKDCAFQFANSDGVVFFDTKLITREEANELFDKNIPLFIEQTSLGEDPEMCIWINMASETDYHETAKYWNAEDMVLKDGRLYELVLAV